MPPAGSPAPTASPVPARGWRHAAEFSFADSAAASVPRLQRRRGSLVVPCWPSGRTASFYGEYHDTDMGGGEPGIRAVQWNCKFTGRFAQPVQVNDYTYSMGIAEISYEKEAGAEG
ncbi:MAG: hypothetical protein ACLRWQ_21905 [Flavonifractor plautii]